MYDSSTQTFDRRTRIVEQWRHPNFNLNNGNLNWDVLVMRLEEPVYDIEPVPLNSDTTVPAENEILVSAGFGATEYLGDTTTVLREGQFQYIIPGECDNLISAFKLTGVVGGEELLCTGSTGDGNSICLGDSGGPLLTQDGVLVGITSWTVQCETSEIPDGFARISAMYSWIKEKVCEISVETPDNCPQSATFPQNDGIAMRLRFRFDSSPEDTTFSVRNQQTGTIEYAGPTYVVPDRDLDTEWISDFFLPEGNYTFEVYDKEDNGMVETGLSQQQGFWELYAKSQDGSTNFTLVASGDGSFAQTSATNFMIKEVPTVSPTKSPSPPPSFRPTLSPSISPTKMLTSSPTFGPTFSPSVLPTTPMPSSTPSELRFTSPPKTAPIGTSTLDYRYEIIC